jgi:hypothetical protein
MIIIMIMIKLLGKREEDLENKIKIVKTISK